MAYLDRQDVIDHLRKTNPRYNAYFPNDDELYEHAYRHINPKKWTGNPEAEFEPPEFAYQQRQEEQEKAQLTQRAKDTPVTNIKTKHPRTWAEFNFAGWLGETFDNQYLKYAATQGLTDLGRVITTGKSGYKLVDENTGQEISPEEYSENLTMVEEVGSWLLGQANAVDLGLWIGTAGVGKYFQVGATALGGKQVLKEGSKKILRSPSAQNWFQKKWAGSVLDNFASNQIKKGGAINKWAAEVVTRYPSTAASLGTFTFASTTMHSAVNQRKSEIDPETGLYVGDIDPLKVVTDAGYEGVKAATLLAAPTAGVAPLYSGLFRKAASKLEKSNSNFNLRLSKLIKNNENLLSTIPAIPTEGAIFGNLPYLIEGVPTLKDGSTDWETVTHDFAHGTLTVTGLKGAFGLFNKIGSKFTADNKNRNAGKIQETPEGKLQRETVESIRADLEGVMKPAEVEKFIKKLSESEKIKVKGDKDASFPEMEINDYIVSLLKESRVLESKINEPGFKMSDLTPLEINKAMEVHNSLHALKQVYTERLTEKGGQDYLRYVASEYNATKSKELPLWKDLPKTEKQKIIKAGQTQLKRLTKDIQNYQLSINENIYKPKHESKVSTDKTKEQILKRFDKLNTVKQSEIQSEVGKMGEMTSKQVRELEQKMSKLEARLTPEQQLQKQTIEITELKQELIENFKPETYKSKEWADYLETRIDPKNLEKSIKNLKETKVNRERATGKISDYIASEKDTQQSESKENIEIKQFIKNNKTLKNLSKDEKIALINAVNSRAGQGKTRSVTIKRTLNNLTKLMEQSKSKSLFELESFDTINWYSKIQASGKTVSPNLSSDINILSESLKDKGVIKANFSSPSILKELGVVSKQTKAISQAGKDIDVVEVGQAIVDIRTGGEKAKVKLKGKEKAALDLMSETGIRDQEINALQWKHYDPTTKTLDLRTEAAGKSTGDSRYLYLDNAQAKQIEVLKGNSKSNDFIFGKAMSKKITQALKQQSGNKKLTAKNVRKVVEQMAEDSGLSKLEAAVWEKITGHQVFSNIDAATRNRLGKIYTSLANTKMAREMQKAVLDKVMRGGEGITSKIEAKYKQRIPRLEKMTVEPGKPVGPEATRSEKSRFKEKYLNKYPELTVELNKRKLKGDKGEYLPENVLETVAGLEVKVRQGAPIEAAVHGTIHPIIKTLRAIAKTNKNKKLGKEAAGLMREIEARITKTPEFKKWYKQYIKEGMKPGEARDRAIEEATATKMGEIVSGRLVDKTVFKRMSDWAKRVYTNIKTYFKDVSKLSNNELFDLFGQKIYNRNLKEIPLMNFTRETKGKMQFMTVKPNASSEAIRETLIDSIQDYAKRMGLKTKAERNQLINNLIRDEGLPANFDINMANTAESVALISRLLKSDYQAIKPHKDALERLDVQSQIKTLQAKTNLVEKDMVEFLKSLDVEGGLKQNATIKDLKDWRNVLYDRMDKDVYSRLETKMDLLSDKDFKELNPKLDNTIINKIKLGIGQNVMGMNRLAKMLGLKKLHRWYSTHLSSEQSHIGRLNGFIDRAKTGKAKKSWKKAEDVFGLLEAKDNGNFHRINDKTVDAKDKAKAVTFIKKTFKTTEKINKKTGEVELYNEGINWEPNTRKGTPEGELMYYFKHNVMKYYEKQFNELAILRFPLKGAREKFMKDNDIQFLNKTNEGFYIPIRYSKQFHNFHSPQMIHSKKGIQKVGKEYAVKMAKKKYGEKFENADAIKKAQMIEEFIESGIHHAKSELLTAIPFGAGKVTFKSLISRNKFQFPQTITSPEGKKIKVFENNFDAVMQPYGGGFGKLLTNMEHATWSVGLKGYGFTGDVEAMLKETAQALDIPGDRGQKIVKLLKDGMMERTGLSKDTDIMPGLTNITREYTSTLMRLQLGGPIPMTGIWNYMEQAKQMSLAFDVVDVFRSQAKSFLKTERMKTEEAGAVSSVGLLGYKPKSKVATKLTDLIFNTGGMPFSESVGRTWARLASGMEVQRLVDHLQTLPEGSKKHKYALDRMKKFYELDSYQIKTLKEHGFEPNLSGLPQADAIMIKRTVDGAFRKAELVGNIKTAGSTVDATMPWWANLKLSKPLLMYKRIALSTSMNNMELLRYNLKHKHFMRTGLFVGGTFIKGAARIALLKALFNTSTANVENTDWWTSFWAHMYNGEILGVTSELFSPYKDSYFSFQDNVIQEAAMVQNFNKTAALLTVLTQSAGKKIDAPLVEKILGEQKMSLESAGTQWLRSTVSGYNNYYKIMNQKRNPYNSAVKSIQVWTNDWNRKHAFKSRDDHEADEATQYMRNLRTVFNTGTKEQFHEELILMYLSLTSRYISNGYTESGALKEAGKTLETKLAGLSPIAYSVDPSDNYRVAPIEGLLATLDDEQLTVVYKTYTEYEKRLKEYKKSFPYFLRQQNMGDLLKKFDFKIDDKYIEALNKRIKNAKRY